MTEKTDSPIASAAVAAVANAPSTLSSDGASAAPADSAGAAAAPSEGAGLEIPEVKVADAATGGDAAGDKALDMLGDVELDVKVELGRCQMLVGDVLRLQEGDVVELDKLAGDPVDVYVNERLVARGEVLVVNENFCVRVNQIVAKED
jgi:flagellar motor switch protein FliN/FliY